MKRNKTKKSHFQESKKFSQFGMQWGALFSLCFESSNSCKAEKDIFRQKLYSLRLRSLSLPWECKRENLNKTSDCLTSSPAPLSQTINFRLFAAILEYRLWWWRKAVCRKRSLEGKKEFIGSGQTGFAFSKTTWVSYLPIQPVTTLTFPFVAFCRNMQYQNVSLHRLYFPIFLIFN